MILGYKFFQSIIIALLLYSMLASIIGTFIVLRRITYISGGISHAAFGGIGIGLFLSLNPILVTIPFTIVFVLTLFFLGKKLKIDDDSTISMIWSLGMSIGIIFLSFTKGYSGYFLGYLFGNILSISNFDLKILFIFLIITIIIFFMFLKELVFILLDAEYAKIIGVNNNLIDIIFYFVITLGIIIMIKISGVIVNIVFLTIAPLITKELFTDLYKMFLFNFLFNLILSFSGILISFIFDLPTGPCMIIVSFLVFLIYKIIKNSRQSVNYKSTS